MSEIAVYTPPSTAELEQTWQLASKLAKTEFVPSGLRGRPEAVLACMLTGREIGIGPMQALKHIPIIEGTPGMSAELMAALIRRAGHKLRIITRAPDEAEVEGVRADDPDHPLRIRWILADAVRAKLCTLDKDGRPVRRDSKGRPMPWELYPAALLLARAISALGRAMFSDVLAGCGYTPEELRSGDGIATEATWGDAEVVTDPGRLDGTPQVAQPAGTIPTREQIQELRDPGAARALWHRADTSFQDEVQVACGPAGSWTEFYKRASTSQWQQTLIDALKAFNQSAVSGVAPPAATADPTSDPPAEGDTAGGSEPNLLEGPSDG